MDVDPYAAPRTRTGPAREPGRAWLVRDVFTRAVDVVKRHGVVLSAAVAIPLIVIVALRGAARALADMQGVFRIHGIGDAAPLVLSAIAGLGALVLQAFFQVGVVRMFLDAVRGRAPELRDLVSGFDRAWPMLIAVVLFDLAVWMGTLFLIVPGVIALCGLLFHAWFVVDQELGAFGALQASWATTRGQKGRVFLLLLTTAALAIAGLAACGVGVFPALAIAFAMQGLAYVRMTGREHVSRPSVPSWPGGAPPMWPVRWPVRSSDERPGVRVPRPTS